MQGRSTATSSTRAGRKLVAVMLGLFVAGFDTAALAVDGFSVTVHWTGVNHLQYGGYGEIWRHDLEGGEVVSHRLLHPGPARAVAISNDGARVAFLRRGGMLAVMPAGGGPVVDLAQSHPEAHVDWPLGDWVYYTLGGYQQYTSSRYLRRVNAVTGVDEPVVTFDRGTWRFAIASDLQRAVVRVNDQPIEPWGRIVAYDLAQGGGVLSLERATERFSCSLGIDPSGTYFLDGWELLHHGTDIRRWDDLTVVQSISHEQAAAWGGPDSGLGHNLNNWSANSTEWIAIHLGWGIWGSNGANQVLYNWIDQQRIVVTNNSDGSGSFDSAGDFWVAGAEPTAGELLPPTIQHDPRDQRVVAGQQAVFAVSATSGWAATYRWQRDGVDIAGADGWSLTTGPASVADDGARYRCVVTNAHGSTISQDARLEVLPEGTELINQPPVVDAGIDVVSATDSPVLLVGTVTDDGLPAGSSVSLIWSQVAGPATARIARPDQERTLVTIDVAGSYAFRLTADDGVASASDDVVVVVRPRQSITLVSPGGGEVWPAGSSQRIRWETHGVDDVAILFSADGGQSWETIAASIDRRSPHWGAYEWVVPDRRSTRCMIALSAYVDSSNESRSEIFEISAPEQTYQGSGQPPGPPPPAPGGCALGAGNAPRPTTAVLLVIWLLICCHSCHRCHCRPARSGDRVRGPRPWPRSR